MADYQVRDLTRVTPEKGRPYWTARLVIGKTSLDVDSRFGSWQADVGGARMDVMPAVAAALQAKVRPLEKEERREREAVAA